VSLLGSGLHLIFGVLVREEAMGVFTFYGKGEKALNLFERLFNNEVLKFHS
jgi:hypothetical protein